MSHKLSSYHKHYIYGMVDGLSHLHTHLIIIYRFVFFKEKREKNRYVSECAQHCQHYFYHNYSYRRHKRNVERFIIKYNHQTSDLINDEEYKDSCLDKRGSKSTSQN
eukprot:274986_1